jgi:hypothetical protein
MTLVLEGGVDTAQPTDIDPHYQDGVEASTSVLRFLSQDLTNRQKALAPIAGEGPKNLDPDIVRELAPFAAHACATFKRVSNMHVATSLRSRRYDHEPQARVDIGAGILVLTGKRELDGVEGDACLAVSEGEEPDSYRLHLRPIGSIDEIMIPLSGDPESGCQTGLEALDYGARVDLAGCIEGYRELMLELA